MRVFFLHVSKTGGTSLRKLFDKSFKIVFPCLKNNQISAVVTEFDVIYGHYRLAEIPHEQVFKHFYTFTILRNPIERWLSQYYQFIRAYEEVKENKCADYSLIWAWEKINEGRFLADCVHDAWVCRQFSTLPSGAPDEKHFEEAIKNIHRFNRVAFFENYANDMHLVLRDIGLDPAMLAKENSPKEITGPSWTYNDVAQLVGKSELDLKFYAYAKQIFSCSRFTIKQP